MLTNSKFVFAILLLAINFSICQTVIVAENQSAGTYINNKNKYSKPAINTKLIERQADRYFGLGLENHDETTKEAYLMKALEKYMLLFEYNPLDVVSCTQIAIINDNLGNDSTALEYFKKAVNIGYLNPFANFHFAEYYFSKRDYRNALRYYLIAYDNGYDNYYQVSLKLATIYEKFGDFKNAKKYYIISQKHNPELRAGVIDKLKSLNKVYYSKSDYR